MIDVNKLLSTQSTPPAEEKKEVSLKTKTNSQAIANRIVAGSIAQ